MGWALHLDALKDFFGSQSFSSRWLEETQICDKIDELSAKLDSDLRFLEKHALFIFSPSDEAENHTRLTIDLFRRFATGEGTPSLVALGVFAMRGFKINDPDLQRLVLAAAVLGEIDNNLPYHSNMHYRKVMFQIMRMTAVYNGIYQGTSRAFDERQIALLLTAACIHDVAHDGKGNTLKGVYIPHRLEQNSYDIVAPVFDALGNRGEHDLGMIRVMLLCTDVTPFKDQGNAVNQAKAAYRYHFLSGKNMMEGLNLDDDLRYLEKCPAMSAMALMIHEADIATSAGLHYDITKYETGLLMLEVSDGTARPEHVINFLNDVCNRQMLSEVGQQLFAANLARIYALAEDDFKAGNQPYPALDQSDFMKGYAMARPTVYTEPDSIN